MLALVLMFNSGLLFVLRFTIFIFIIFIISINDSNATRDILSYNVILKGSLPDKMDAEIKKISSIFKDAKKELSSYLALKRRLKKDVKNIKILMRSRGYFDAKVKSEIRDKSKIKFELIVTITAGKRYRHGQPLIKGVEASYLEKMPLIKGKFYLGRDVENLREELLKRLRNDGYHRAVLDDPVLKLHRKIKTSTVAFNVTKGPLVRFGDVTFKNRGSTKESFLNKRIAWKKGDIYTPKILEETRQAFVQTNIFSGVSIKEQKNIKNPEEADLNIFLVENKRRFYGGGLEVSTSEGFGSKAFWGHRNLFDGGEQLRFEGEFAKLRRGLTGDIRFRDIFIKDQDFLVKIDVSRKRTDAFQSQEREISAGFDHSFNKIFKKKLILTANHQKVERQIFSIIDLSLNFERDSRDFVFDAKKGSYIGIQLNPHYSFTKKDLAFSKHIIFGSKYFPLDSEGKHVIAVRGKMGSIFGCREDIVPRNKRFYTGGTNSVRGYEYQHAGPLRGDPKNKTPKGGCSMLEMSLEWRWRFGNMGIVPFIDGGNVYSSTFPKVYNIFDKKKPIDQRMFWGAGIGGRYYLKKLGPIRVDIAIPINRRNKIDKAYQFYASFGQSF
jgi:translocation and assembly module TamA